PCLQPLHQDAAGHALPDAEDALDGDAAHGDLGVVQAVQLRADRHEEEVGRDDAPERAEQPSAMPLPSLVGSDRSRSTPMSPTMVPISPKVGAKPPRVRKNCAMSWW